MEKYMMKVQGCCGCVSLRKGTLILLTLGLMGSVRTLFQLLAQNVVSINNAPITDDVTKFVLTLLSVYQFVNLVFLNIIPCALGLYGVHNNKPSYLKPYIFSLIFGIVMALIACVFVSLLAIFSSNNFVELMKQFGLDPKTFGMSIQNTAFSVILLILGYTLLCWYFLSVVYRYYQQMKGVQPTSYSTADFNTPPNYAVGLMKT